jgi:pilus assembly protein CpaF
MSEEIAPIFIASPLETFVADHRWNEIWINGWNNIWIDRDSQIQKIPEGFLSPQDFHQWHVRLQEFIQVETSLERPFGNAQVQSMRFHVVHNSVGGGNCLLAIRKLGHLSHSLEDLQGLGWCTASQREIIQNIIKDRLSLLFVGATSAGKTTSMNACLKEIQHSDRAVLIEDTPELSLPNPLSVRLETRGAVDGGLPEITYRHLIREALRMRPDRLVIGEVRSGETADLLLALSTGHKGSVCTLHAESAAAAVSRLEVLASMGAPTWSLRTIRELIFHGLQAVIVCERDPKTGQRKLGGVFKIQSLETSGIIFDQIA